MTKIKICGLRRPEDVQYVNQAKPDLAGFIIRVPFSRRSLEPEELRRLRPGLSREITAVGVFVNADPELPASLLREGLLDMVQLHGQEDEEYIRKLQKETGKPVMKTFSISDSADIRKAFASPADLILLDHGAGGTGRSFDWNLLKSKTDRNRPFFLAGGITPETIQEAVKEYRPYGIDLSSAVETKGKKDPEKILAAVAAVRSITI